MEKLTTQKQSPSNRKIPFLWGSFIVLLLALLFARVLAGEMIGLTVTLLVLLVLVIGTLIRMHAKALQGRSAAYGLNSIITVLLILGIVGVINFMGDRYPQKLDLTKNKTHTLSEQTVKIVKGLTHPVKATLFAKTTQRDQSKILLDNYKALNPKLEIEYVDPDKEPVRAKAAGIRKYGTLQLTNGTKTSNVDDVNEEKFTNALIKILKEKTQTLCAITGHGEKSFGASDVEGYSAAKAELTNQSYTVKDVSLLNEGKIPADCDAIAILGPQKAYFKNEADLIRSYLAEGGRAVVETDLNFRGGAEFNPELISILEDWHVKPELALVLNRGGSFPADLGPSASIIALFSKDSPITRDFKYESIFPSARPLSIVPNAPVGMNVQFIAQTLPTSFEVDNMAALGGGKLTVTGREKPGPFSVAVTVEGKQKDSKAPRNTRLAVFGTSLFAVNGLANRGGNLDFFLNAISWALEDESLISIRAKEDAPSKVEISAEQSKFIMLVTVILVPILIAIAGVVIWIFRRRL